jgi:hypothetical protein
MTMLRIRGLWRTGVLLVAFAALWPASAEPAKPDVCVTPSAMTLTGKIRDLQSMREEPEAEMQAFFYLDLVSPLCGKTEVSASVIGTIPCLEGDTVTMSGEFSPPEKMFDTARLRGQRSVTCPAAPE